MTRAAPVPSWAHTVENIGGVWRCSGAASAAHVSREDFRRCDFADADLQAAIAHVNANQYDAPAEKPVDARAT